MLARNRQGLVCGWYTEVSPYIATCNAALAVSQQSEKCRRGPAHGREASHISFPSSATSVNMHTRHRVSTTRPSGWPRALLLPVQSLYLQLASHGVQAVAALEGPGVCSQSWTMSAQAG